MSHKTKNHHHRPESTPPVLPAAKSPAPAPWPTLALVIKGDTDGGERAICELITRHAEPGVPIEIIHQGVGDICKTDIMTAATGSRLILGFNVNVLPKLAELCREQRVEIRLYSVIYKLHEDLMAIARSLLPFPAAEEKILGRATVIALFKSSRKGIILGCRVDEGRLHLGDTFRIISAMGPVYSGAIASLHIERDRVDKATVGQQVGLKIDDFQSVRLGDLVESYQTAPGREVTGWRPSGKILHR